MRLYPPAWITSREVVAPVTVGGVAMAPRDQVIVSPYVTHRDPRYWDDPETYDPSRFTNNGGPRERYAYFPFGGGSRMCIGDSFAWTEGVIALATIAQRVRLERVPGDPDVAVQPVVTLRPLTAIRAKVRVRGPVPSRVPARTP
jgi:cytochrome P450